MVGGGTPTALITKEIVDFVDTFCLAGNSVNTGEVVTERYKPNDNRDILS